MVERLYPELYRQVLDHVERGFRVALVHPLPPIEGAKRLFVEDADGAIHEGRIHPRGIHARVIDEGATHEGAIHPEGGGNSSGPDAAVLERAKSAIASGQPALLRDPGEGPGEGLGEALIEPFWPEPALLVLGGGHIAVPLVQLASLLGFAVTVVDDRPSFANAGRFPTASRIVCDAFERAIPHLPITKWTFVVIATRGHAHDLDCLRECMKRESAYLGMVSSHRRAREVRSLLEAEGYPKERIGRLHSPVGLDIGAVTPAEIAVSILSQVIATRRAARSWPEFDRTVLSELAAGADGAGLRAAVTLVSTKGSTPRQAGARMLVWADGRTLGSIGGGCVEAEVILAARDAALKGTRSRRQFALTADAGAKEGMACGGVMDVLIEPA
ncbi:MAG: XdhC family protein [Bacillota bacterium]